jgi:hypothetical protein
MKTKAIKVLVPDEVISNQIYFIRKQKVMLDRDLAKLYEVETKVLKQALKRNIDRFPSDFMFQLTKKEELTLRSQIVTLKRGEHSKYLTMAFTEQGVSMLSSVLNSKRAITLNIQIIRLFTKLRKMLSDSTELKLEIEQIKKKVLQQSNNIELVFKYLDELIEKKDNPKPRIKIGYKVQS